jgi:hypothetical protein
MHSDLLLTNLNPRLPPSIFVGSERRGNWVGFTSVAPPLFFLELRSGPSP